ncbi:MAG TPA: putative Ig domain-containing protein [Vicinamibacterales bacterium]|jgi:hypothetical protein
MRKSNTMMRICMGIAAALVVTAAQPARAANYPLELTNIRAAGANMNSSHRIFRAYPGLMYNIRAAVIGGDLPYTFSLTNAPAGMTIDARGEIFWPNPQANATPTITVRDAAGAQVTATWTIQVTTTGFRFVNANAAAGGNGSAASPWRTMVDVYNNAAQTDIIYWRAGTYSQLTLPRTGTGGDWERVEWYRHASIWLAYPGETPVIDFGYRAGGSERAPAIRLNDDLVYVDGFETVNSRLIAFQFTGMQQGPTFRKLRMHAHGPGTDGSNASFIMTMISLGSPTSNMVVQDSEFWDLTGLATTLKIYSQRKLLIEDTVQHDATYGVELKADVSQFTVRNNYFYDCNGFALGGNMHYDTTYGEILLNYIRSADALQLNNDSDARTIHVYRNTLVGRVLVSATDSADGPFYFINNVIVNSNSGTPAGSHITYEEVSAPSRIIQVNNLAGYPSDNIVDGAGNLTTAYAAYRGTHGHTGGGTTPPVPNAPAAPTNVRIIR